MESNKPQKLYKTIMADPPWDIEQKGARGAVRHYRLMTLDQIKAMPVADLADPEGSHCLCFMNQHPPRLNVGKISN
jgi:N6-adenosine-specific RNA methylase IME4